MSEQNHQHHHHHHHREDYASKFKRKSLNSIAFRRKLDKWLKIALFILAIIMVLLVIFSTLFG
jgi:hypothetical protein